MKFVNLNLIVCVCVVALLSSCKKDELIKSAPPASNQTGLQTSGINLRKGFAALNKSGYLTPDYTTYPGAVNYYDFDSGTFYPDVFKTVNGIELGSTPSAIKLYGSKIYILTIENIQVVNAKTCKLIKTVKSSDLAMNDIVFYKSTAYISNSLGGIAPMDTTALEYGAGSGSGFASTGMVISNDKLFAVGGEYYNFWTGKNQLGNRVSVINPNSLESIKSITFPDPHNITKDKYGNVYVTNNDGLGIISSTTYNIIYNNANLRASTGLDPNSLVIADNYALMLDVNRTKVSVFDIRTRQIIKNNFIADGTAIKPGKLSVDEVSHEVYVRDEITGVMYVFDLNGKKKRTLDNSAFGTGATVFINN